MQNSSRILIKNANLRDLGGLKNKNGLTLKSKCLLRSGHLAELEKEEFTQFKDIGLKTIIDLRRPSEIEKYPTPQLKEIRTLNFSLSSDDNEFAVAANLLTGDETAPIDTKALMKKYFSESVDKNIDVYQKLFYELIDVKNFPLLFHCVAGKDRTGIVSTLILGLLDVDESVILEDYLLTNKLQKNRMGSRMLEIRDRLSKNPVNNSEEILEEKMEGIRMLLSAHEDFLTATLNGVHNRFDSWENFRINGLKIDDERFKKFKNFILT